MSFLDDYFLKPILANGYFNPVNTAVYGIILVAAVYLVYRLLRRMKISIDKKFFYAVLPFIFWGSSTRVLHDAAFKGALSPALNAFYSQPFFPTPGSYFITFALAIAALLASLAVQRFFKAGYWKTMSVAGWILVVINLILLPYTSVIPFILIAGSTVLWSALFYGIWHFFGKRKIISATLSINNQVVLAAHMLDASATFFALSFFGYMEQHVVPNFLIPLLGPAVMFPLKIVVVIPVLYLIDRYGEPGNFNNFLKIVIFILGLAPGLRDLLRLMAGV